MSNNINRKEKIALAALHLFAERGYENTTTSLIANTAGVSEALIFKHFGNKENLLNYVVKSGYNRIITHNRGMVKETDPLKLIFKVIDLPKKLILDEPEFWKLQTRLMDIEPYEIQYQLFLHPVYTLLTKAFTDLEYINPEKETELILLMVEGMWKSYVAKKDEQTLQLAAFIKTKYGKQ